MVEIKPDVHPATKPLKRLKKELKKYRRVLAVVDSGIAHLPWGRKR